MKRILLLLSVAMTMLSAIAADNTKVTTDLTKSYQNWDAAQCGADIPKLEQIFADEVRLTGPDGELDTKQSFVAKVKSGEYKCSNPSTTELKVERYGDTAVATGVWKATEIENGQKSDCHYRFTDTWVKRQGQWRLVASQVTTVKPTK